MRGSETLLALAKQLGVLLLPFLMSFKLTS